jgi:hypothetical protein
MRLLFVAAAALAIALLWSLYEGKRAHALDVAGPVAQVTGPLAGPATPIAHSAAPIIRTTTNTVPPVVNGAAPVVRPVADALKPVVQPVIDAVAPGLQPVARVVGPILQSTLLPRPAAAVLETAPRAPSATAVAHVIATAVAQVSSDAIPGGAGHLAAIGMLGSLPYISGPALPALPLPALRLSFPTSVPLSHAPGGLGRTLGGGLAVLVAVAAAASLRRRRFRFATGAGQSIFLASLIERPG